ncbi:MAG: MBL fold metallo-hydrolase [Archaeoglobaceae archaeon]
MKLKSRGCNVYLVEINDKIFLIDAGTDGGLVAKQVKELDGILITHAHFDHVAGVRELEKVFGCPIYVHPDDAPYLLGEKEFTFHGVIGKMAKMLEKLFRFVPPENVRSILEVNVNIVHTPGHTPGSVCILVNENAYCGDLLRGGGRLSRKEFCSDYEKYLQSVKAFLSFEWKKAFPGHGKEIDKSVKIKIT